MERVKCIGAESPAGLQKAINNFICEHGVEIKDVQYLPRTKELLSWYAMVKYNVSYLDDFVSKIKSVHYHLKFGFARFDRSVGSLDGEELPDSKDITKGILVCNEIKSDFVKEYAGDFSFRYDKLYWDNNKSAQENYDKCWRDIQDAAYNSMHELLIITINDVRFMGMCGYFGQLGKWGNELVNKNGEKFVFDGYVLIDIVGIDWPVASNYAKKHDAAGYEEMWSSFWVC